MCFLQKHSDGINKMAFMNGTVGGFSSQGQIYDTMDLNVELIPFEGIVKDFGIKYTICEKHPLNIKEISS